MENKIFVLDTSVILFDHKAILQFKEHDIVIPISVLEELDNFKKGNDTINFEARQFIRYIDQRSKGFSLSTWIPIVENGVSLFKVVMDETIDSSKDANKVFGFKKNDHQILNAALKIQDEYRNRQVILVSKDINLRLKARSLDISAEDYETGKINDVEGLYRGIQILDVEDDNVITHFHQSGSISKSEVLVNNVLANSFFIIKNNKNSSLARFCMESDSLIRVEKQIAYGIKPKNAEQTFAMNALLNPELQLITIQGVAGTGKTLLALAAAIEQRSLYRQIFLARPIVPLNNKDIGFLPGDIKQKINPYMEPLWDNLKFIQSQFSDKSKEFQKIRDLIDSEKLLVTPLAYIRGRSLSNIIFIVDEAQNLTPLEVKTIVTRAGENTKIIFTGDIYQIDTPYLDAQSNGLSYLIDKFKGQKMYAHITLEKGERSLLANLANQLL